MRKEEENWTGKKESGNGHEVNAKKKEENAFMGEWTEREKMRLPKSFD